MHHVMIIVTTLWALQAVQVSSKNIAYITIPRYICVYAVNSVGTYLGYLVQENNSQRWMPLGSQHLLYFYAETSASNEQV